MSIGHLYIFFDEMCIKVFYFSIGYFFVVFELYELFLYFGNQGLVSCIICKYLLPFCMRSFCKIINFMNYTRNIYVLI